MLKKFFLTAAFVLALAGVVRADAVTTNVTINPPGQGSTAGVTNTDGGVGSGRSYTNLDAVGAPMAGQAVKAEGAIPVTSFNTVGGGFGLVSSPGHTIVAVFGLVGTATQVTNPFTAQFTAGHLQVWDIHATAFSSTNPGTWGPTTMGATMLANYTLNSPPMNTLSGFPLGEAINVPVINPITGQPVQNVASVDFTGADTTGQFQFNKVTDTLFTSPLPFDGQQVKITEEFLNMAGTGLDPNGTGIAGLDAVWAALFGGGTFSTFPDGDTFNPDGTGANGDTVQNIGFHADPTQSIVVTATVVVVPEIDPASMAGALAMLGAGWMMLTGRRKRK
jgi:hypothetical protein